MHKQLRSKLSLPHKNFEAFPPKFDLDLTYQSFVFLSLKFDLDSDLFLFFSAKPFLKTLFKIFNLNPNSRDKKMDGWSLT